MYALDEACRPDQDREDTGAYCPIHSMVRESCDCIIGDAPPEATPFGETVRCQRLPPATLPHDNRGGNDEHTPEAGQNRRGLSQLNLNAAGIDVGATSHFVRGSPPTARNSRCVSTRLSRQTCIAWRSGWPSVGSRPWSWSPPECTGYPCSGCWKSEASRVMLVDPRRIKNVPGRKSDVVDCQWLQQLHTYGLLSGAFRPGGDIRRLRSYLRQRAMLVEYASHHIQHMHKALTQMNVKLQHVIRDITGKTGMDIIEAIVVGERDPRKLARLRDRRIKADEATIAKSLQGHWREEHIFELAQAVELYRTYQAKITECDREIEAQLERFEDRSDGEPPASNGKKRNQGNAPRFDVQGQLYRMTGVDLTRIDGVDGFTALKVTSEVGTDMTKWPSAKHFASWLGLSPNNRITGGRVISSKTKASANRAAAALRLAANALHRSDSALGAFLRRKKAHLGAPKAITATAHKLACIIYAMLRHGQEYVDAGAEYYELQYQQRALRAAKRRAAQLGYQLVPLSDGEHHPLGVPLNPPAAVA